MVRFVAYAAMLLLAGCAASRSLDVNARACAVLTAFEAPDGVNGYLSRELGQIAHETRTEQLPPGGLLCNGKTFRTDVAYNERTYRSIGYTADGRYAAVRYDTWMGPATGYSEVCLVGREGRRWRRLGCSIGAIT